MERYTDEKNPEVVYGVAVDASEPEQPKPKRPLWRRFVRIILTVSAVFLLWSTFAPAVHHRCHRHRPSSDFVPPFDLAMDYNVDDAGIPVENYTFPADLDSFWLKEDSFHGFTRAQVIGNVIVHSCPKAENISAHFKFKLSDPSLRSKISVEPDESGILFKLNAFSMVKETINATIVLVIPKSDKYTLNKLRIGTIELPILVRDTFTTPINSTSFSTVSAPVSVFGKASSDNGLDINNLQVKTVSGSIIGEFPLNHALDLETTSGDIQADLVSSDLPEKIAWLKTATVSGQTFIKFVSNLNPRPLYSKHESVSGDVNVEYPKDWQGGLKLTTTSGHVKVEGEGTKIVKKDKDFLGKLWKVIKGDGKSKGFIGTVSGKIDVLIGKTEDKE